MLQNYIDKLKHNLKKPLPGYEAHQKMMPVRANQESFNSRKNSATKSGSVLILLYPKENGVYIPLMQRPDYQGAHGGQISLPGGKKETQDKDLIATAIRESEEEIGVKPEEINVLGTLSELYVFASNFTVLPVVGICDHEPMFVPNPYEVEEIIEISLDTLLKTDTLKTTTLNIRDVEIHAPYFDAEGKVVWGATAMILSEFIALLK